MKLLLGLIANATGKLPTLIVSITELSVELMTETLSSSEFTT